MDIARKRALDNIRINLRHLAANILRITRGAGDSYALGRQALDFADALGEYAILCKQFPEPYVFDEALRLELPPDLYERFGSEEYGLENAQFTIIKGALQIVASKMRHQLTQERAGEEELRRGINNLQEIREERRRRYAREAAANRPRENKNNLKRKKPAPK